MRGALAIALLVACGGGPSPADDMPPDDDQPPMPGTYADPLVPHGVMPKTGMGGFHPAEMHADGNTLYMCGSPGGIAVWNVTNPDAPMPRFGLQPDGRRKCQHLAIDGNLLVAASRGDESDPIPFVAAFDRTMSPHAARGVYRGNGESFEGVAAGNGHVYVAQHAAGIVVLLQAGTTLNAVGQLTTGFTNAWDVAITGTTLVVADAGFGVRTVDVSNPAAPVLLGSLAIPNGSPQAIVIAGTTAYVGLGAGGIAVVDLANASVPALLATVDTPGSVVELSISSVPPGRGAGTYLYVADWDDARVYDVATPSAPRLVASETVADAQGKFTRLLGAAGLGTRGFWGEFGGQIHAFDLFPDRVAPEVRPATIEIAFRRTMPGGASAYALILTNEGSAPLAISSVAITNAVFSGDRPYFTIEAGKAAVLEVVFAPTSSGQAVGAVTFTTDDPDEKMLVVDLVGNRPGLQVGDPAPDVTVALLGGGTWKLSDQIGKHVLLSYFATF